MENDKELTEVSKKLSTWLALDVYYGLVEFAKQNTLTGLGKFDFSTAIRILLQKSKVFDGLEVLNQRMNEIELRLHELENKNIDIPKESSDTFEVKTLGDIKLKGGKN